MGVWAGYQLYSHIQQRKRDRMYQSVLNQYRQGLRLGMSRIAVEEYLNSHHIRFADAGLSGSGNAWSDEIRIGTDPSGRIDCANWEVYIALDFDNPSRQPGEGKGDPPGEPEDVLKNIRVYKFCW